mgnify:CR=1 FL=1
MVAGLAKGVRYKDKPCRIGQIRNVLRGGINNPCGYIKFFKRLFKCPGNACTIPCQVNGFTGRYVDS